MPRIYYIRFFILKLMLLVTAISIFSGIYFGLTHLIDFDTADMVNYLIKNRFTEFIFTRAVSIVMLF